MADQPIVFALANPRPEIDPQVAHDAGVAVMATGSSQYPNQVNNVLVFPGLFRGLLRSGIKKVTPELEVAVARGLSALVAQPQAEEIIPGVFNSKVVDTVTQAVIQFAH